METQRYLYETHMHTSEASACAGSTCICKAVVFFGENLEAL